MNKNVGISNRNESSKKVGLSADITPLVEYDEASSA